MNESSQGLDAGAQSAYAVYDAKTGRIVHLHRVTVHGDAAAPSSDENEARALELARQHHDAELEVLEISPQDLEGRAPQQVDLATGALKADPAG